MISKLKTILDTLHIPNRSVDVDIHEALTGEINECKSGVLETSRAHGRILREKGGELLWFDVPSYTLHVEEAFALLPAGYSYALSYLPTAHKAAGSSSPWAALLRDDRLDPILVANHAASPAIAVCKLAVEWRMKK